jgi:hypothetical protein
MSSSSSDETLPTLDQLEEMAAPIAPLKAVADDERKRKREIEEEQQEQKRRAKERRPSLMERHMVYLKSMIKHHKESKGASTSLCSTHIDTDLPRAHIVDLASKTSINKLIEFKYTCCGFKHLVCRRVLVLTPESAEDFPWCADCVEVQAMYERYRGFSTRELSSSDDEDDDDDDDDKSQKEIDE